jgi:hypothetical protein
MHATCIAYLMLLHSIDPDNGRRRAVIVKFLILYFVEKKTSSTSQDLYNLEPILKQF